MSTVDTELRGVRRRLWVGYAVMGVSALVCLRVGLESLAIGSAIVGTTLGWIAFALTGAAKVK